MPFPRIFCQETVIAFFQIGSGVEGGRVFGQIEAICALLARGCVGAEHGDVVGHLFVLAHAGETEREARARLVHFLKPAVEAQFHVAAVNPGVAIIEVAVLPVEALLSAEEFDVYALKRPHRELSAAQGIVYAERTLFVGAQDKARAELLVEVAEREVEAFVMARHVEIRNTAPLEPFVETGQRVLQTFVAHAGGKVFVEQIKFHVGIRERPVVFGRANLSVFFGKEHIALNAAVEREFLAVVALRICAERGKRQEAGGYYLNGLHSLFGEGYYLPCAAMSSRTFSIRCSSPPSV